MKTFTDLIKNNRIFFLLYIIFFFFGLLYSVIFPREHSLLILNSFHNSFFDSFFKYMTFLGDGLFILIVILPIAFIRIRYAVLTVITYAVSGIIAQIIKHIVQSPRPLKYLTNFENLHIVQGIDIYYHNSFPSGHSATAFALFLTLSLVTKNNIMSLFFFLIAFFVCISRIYLLQHFLIDVWAGSFIGVITAIVFFIIFEKNKKINNSHWLNFSIYNRLKH